MQPSQIDLAAVGELAEIADYTIAFAVRAVARVGVADALAHGPRNVHDLARDTGTHAPSLLRTLRALASKGVFVEPEPGVFALTPMADLLRDDHPMSMRWAFRIHPDVEAWSAMEHSVRTGEPAFEHVYGTTYWEQLARDREAHWQFQKSQSAMSRIEFESISRVYDWPCLSTVVDLGGNDGTFLAALLARFRQLRGSVVDLPGTAAAAPDILKEAGVAERCAVVAADILCDSLPAGADAYIIKRVLTGFNDDEVRTFAGRVAAAMRPDSRLLILEPKDSGDRPSVAMDLHMLVLAKGSVRSPQSFAELLAPTGLAVTRVVDAYMLNIIEVSRGGT
jgi:hypothetical protein